MKISAENFGPILKASMEIRPMTVLIGKNNIGKSFLAQLLHVASQLRQVLSRTPYRIMIDEHEPLFSSQLRLEEYAGVTSKTVREMGELLKPESSPEEAARQLLDTVEGRLDRLAANAMRGLLERIFAADLPALVNLRSSEAKIEIDFSPNCVVQFFITRTDKIRAKVRLDRERTVRELVRGLEPLLSRVRTLRPGDKRDSAIAELIFITSDLLPRILFDAQRSSSYYFPAGRAGLLEGYNTITSAFYALSPVAPIRGLEMPPLSGTGASFYEMLILRLKGKEGPLKDVAESFKGIIGGEVALEHADPRRMTRMTYRFRVGDKESSVDILHAGSMVKELGPLYLVARELVQPEDLLIIEEPESHLHPWAQCRLVEVFARLARRQVNLLITTHSDLLLRKIAHLVGMSRMKHNVETTPLPHKDTVVYWLKEEPLGSVSHEIVIPENGVLESLPSYDEIIRELYEEEVSLQTRLQVE